MLIRELLESNGDVDRAPFGVIFKGDKVAFVGCTDNKLLTMSDDIKDKVFKLIDEQGIWYEGNGANVTKQRQFFGFSKATYENSWDDVFERTVSNYPYQFLYTIFTNIDANKQDIVLTKNSKTIFESIMAAQGKVGYFKDNRKFTKQILTKFLKEMSYSKTNFLEMSEELATKKNVKSFLKAGEKLMWPRDWDEYVGRAAKMAKYANDRRCRWLLDRTHGVYIMDAKRLTELLRLRASLKMIDGSQVK
jgi:hypothetical protein